MSNKAARHIVLRYSDTLYDVDDTIQLHKDVIENAGYVWFGKLGKPISRHVIARLNGQCDDQVHTHLYLVKRDAGSYEFHRGTIMALSRERPKTRGGIPSYYFERGLIQYIKLWIRLSRIDQASSEEISKLVIASSSSSIPQALSTSIAGHFIVKSASPISPPIAHNESDTEFDYWD